jgi:hypothetical protein
MYAIETVEEIIQFLSHEARTQTCFACNGMDYRLP